MQIRDHALPQDPVTTRLAVRNGQLGSAGGARRLGEGTYCTVMYSTALVLERAFGVVEMLLCTYSNCSTDNNG